MNSKSRFGRSEEDKVKQKPPVVYADGFCLIYKITVILAANKI